jgi:hypothetical protein
MIETKKVSGKILKFAPPQPTAEGKLEKWFRGVVQSNQDLMTALERLSDSYKELLGDKPLSEKDQVVLLAAQITLSNARNAQSL